jgi:hypothetical protein
MGLEPTTFCMASRRSSQLSYIRAAAHSSRFRAAVAQRLDPRSRSKTLATSRFSTRSRSSAH